MHVSTVAVSAVVGAVVALGTKLISDQIDQAKAEVEKARTYGYYEGRESLLQQSFQNVEPQDFTRNR